MASYRNMNINVEDLVPAQVFAIMALVQYEIVELTAYEGSLDLSQTYEVAGYDLSLAFIAAAASLGFIIFTNGVEMDDLTFWDDSTGGLDQEYSIAVAGTIALTIGVEFSTRVGDFVTGSDAIATIAFLLAAVAVWVMVWIKG